MRTEEQTMELIKAVKDGSEVSFQRLAEKYDSVVSASSISMIRSFEAEGLECSEETLEDLKQEARLALYKAAMKYDTEVLGRSVTFGLYAKICIKNCLISELRRRRAKKRRETRLAEAALRGEAKEVSKTVLTKIELEALLKESGRLLSPLEQSVLAECAKGCSVSEICENLGRSQKSVNNALYRIRVKLRSFRMKP